MSEVIETVGIEQVNGIRKHLKKLHTVTEYNKRYNKWMYYKPHPDTQLPFHNSHATERSIVLGTQQGKTLSSSYEMAFQSCDFYPEWYKGLKHVVPKLDRDVKFIGWFASNSSQQTRDGAQLRILGDIGQKDGLGTGAIPLDYIRGFTLSRGIPNFVDTVTLSRASGGIASLQSRTYEQQVMMWQSVSCDLIWMDEDPGYPPQGDLLYNEALGRTLATKGRIIASLTPMMGRTPIRKRFIEGAAAKNPNIFQVRGGLEQALHIPKERHQEIIEQTAPSQRLARIQGLEMMGQGACFSTPVANITHNIQNNEMNPNWEVGWGIDFHHGGIAGIFVAAFGFHDPMTDTLYISDVLRLVGGTPDTHLAAISSHPCADAPALYPHDGGRVANLQTQETLAELYRYHPDRRPYGLRMPSTHVTFAGGGYSLPAGVLEMERRFQSGKLRIARWLLPLVRDEYEAYHYNERGDIVREDDHVLDAIRVLMMGIRFMRPQNELDVRRRARMIYNPTERRRHQDPWNPQDASLDYD